MSGTTLEHQDWLQRVDDVEQRLQVQHRVLRLQLFLCFGGVTKAGLFKGREDKVPGLDVELHATDGSGKGSERLLTFGGSGVNGASPGVLRSGSNSYNLITLMVCRSLDKGAAPNAKWSFVYRV